MPGSANYICPVNAGPGEPVFHPELDNLMAGLMNVGMRLADKLKTQGHMNEADVAYRAVLQLQPDCPVLTQETTQGLVEIERRKQEMRQAVALSLSQACSSCPEGHQLELSGEDKGGWRCDVCGEGRSEEGWRCQEDKRWGRGGECDYDVCSGCRQEYKVSGGGREEEEVGGYSRSTLNRSQTRRTWRLRNRRRPQVMSRSQRNHLNNGIKERARRSRRIRRKTC